MSEEIHLRSSSRSHEIRRHRPGHAAHLPVSKVNYLCLGECDHPLVDISFYPAKVLDSSSLLKRFILCRPFDRNIFGSRIRRPFALAAQYGASRRADCSSQYDGCVVSWLKVMQKTVDYIMVKRDNRDNRDSVNVRRTSSLRAQSIPNESSKRPSDSSYWSRGNGIQSLSGKRI